MRRRRFVPVQGVILSFPGAGTTPAAVFVRGMTAWIVIDRAQKVDPVALKGALGDFPTALDTSMSNAVTIIRIGLKAPAEISARADGANLHVDIAPHAAEVPASIGFVRDDSDPKRTDADNAHPRSARMRSPQIDPAAGDTLLVVPGVLGRGVLDARRYAEFAILPTAAGLVIEPYSDDLARAASPADMCAIARPGGLAMTRGPTVSMQSPANFCAATTARHFSILPIGRNRRARASTGAAAPQCQHRRATRRKTPIMRAWPSRVSISPIEFAAEALGLVNLDAAERSFAPGRHAPADDACRRGLHDGPLPRCP